MCSEAAHSQNPASRSPYRRGTRIREKGHSPDSASKKSASRAESIEGRIDVSDEDEVVKERIKTLLEKILSGSVSADDQLESLLRSPQLRKSGLELSQEDMQKRELADAHRLRQSHAGAFYGWRNVQEMTVQLNQEVYALEKRVERRRHVEDLEHWRQKKSDGDRPPPSATTPRAEEESTSTSAESRLEQKVRAALRNSLLGTNGEPRTARFLKRAVLQQWAKVLEQDHDGSTDSTGEEKRRKHPDRNKTRRGHLEERGQQE